MNLQLNYDKTKSKINIENLIMVIVPFWGFYSASLCLITVIMFFLYDHTTKRRVWEQMILYHFSNEIPSKLKKNQVFIFSICISMAYEYNIILDDDNYPLNKILRLYWKKIRLIKCCIIHYCYVWDNKMFPERYLCNNIFK